MVNTEDELQSIIKILAQKAIHQRGTSTECFPDLEKVKSHCLDLYNEKFRKPKIEEIKAILQNEDQLKVLSQFEQMVESPSRNETLTKRIDTHYTAFKSQAIKSSNLKDLKDFVTEFYVHEDRTAGFVGTSTNNFNLKAFLEEITRRVTTIKFCKDDTDTKEIFCFALENGKVVEKEIINFSSAELCDIENTLWKHLTKENLKICTSLQSLVNKHLRLDLKSLESNVDVKQCQSTSNDILTYLLRFISETSADESAVTDTSRLKKYIKFSLLRIELTLVTSSKCMKISELENQIHTLEDFGVENIVATLDSFYEQHRHKDEEIPASCVAETLKILISETDDVFSSHSFETLFHSFLRFIKNKPEDAVDPSNLLKLKQRLLQKFTQEKAHMLTFVLNSALGKQDYANDLLSNCIRISLPLQFPLKNVLKMIETNLITLKGDDDGLIYLAAKFVHRVENEILPKVTLLNLSEVEGELINIVGELRAEITQDLQSLKSVKQTVALQVHVLKVKTNFPFKAELECIAQVYWAEQQLRQKATLTILGRLLPLWHEKKETEISKKEVWRFLVAEVQHFKLESQKQNPAIKEAKALPPNLGVQICDLLLQVKDYDNPLRPFLCRILSKILRVKNDKLPPLVLTNPLNSLITQSELYALLLPCFSKEALVNMFLEEGEMEYVNLRLVDCTYIHDEIKDMLATKSPTTWSAFLEKMLFEHTFNKIISVASELSDEWSSEHLQLRNNFVLKQKKEVQDVFKAAYFLTPLSKRVSWLRLMGELHRSLLTMTPCVLSSLEVIELFFNISIDLEFDEFQEIIYTKFPYNWIRTMLETCILKSMKELEEEDGQVTRKVVAVLSKLLLSINEPKIQFMIILHDHLRNERCRSDRNTRINPAIILSILKEASKFEIPKADFLNMIRQLKATPLSCWCRIIRRQKFKCLNFNEFMINKFLGMDLKYGEGIVDAFAAVLHDPPLISESEPQLYELLTQKFVSSEWILDKGSIELISKSKGLSFRDLCQNLQSYSDEKREDTLSLQDFISAAQEHPLNKNDEDLLKHIKDEILKIRKHLESKYPTSKMEKLKEWIEGVKSKQVKWQEFTDDQKLEIIAIIYRAVQIDASKQGNKIEPRNAQLVSLLLIIAGKKTGGKMGEIETGEGKSLIIAMFSTFCALLGASVYIITANKVLAIEHVDRFKSFYALFGLTIDNNCDATANEEKSRKSRYNNHIVCGDIGSFQADHLQTTFYQKGIMKKRANVLVVDEVDSLLLDKASNMLYLSHDIYELKNLRGVFLIIWEAVVSRVAATKDNQRPANSRNYSERDINIVKTAVMEKLENEKELRFPRCLDKFIKHRLGVWVKQAFKAKFMPRNEEYIVKDADSTVVNMDKDTGIEEQNTQLSLGLQQFLQLRYTSKITSESLKCVFISNHKFISLFQGNIFGITGTLGGDDERELLKTKYKISFFGMPRFKYSKRIDMEPLISFNDEEWLQHILKSALEHPDQPILIISETIAKLKEIMEYLNLLSDIRLPQNQIHAYKSSESDTHVTKNIEAKGGLTSSDLVLSTNLGGRGTDFKISNTAPKGLHLILTYLPSNYRIEKQACGRAARAGESGTTQFVVKLPSEDKNLRFEEVLEKRNINEAERLNQVKRESEKIALEDELFDQYTTFVNKDVRNSSALTSFRKRIRKLQLEFLNNRWAVWLDSIRDQLDRLHLQGETGKNNVMKKFENFKQNQKECFDRNGINGFAQYPSELTKLGILYETMGTKSFFGSLLQADFDEAGNILSESWDSFCNVASKDGRPLMAPIRHRNHVNDKLVIQNTSLTDVVKGELETVNQAIHQVGETIQFSDDKLIEHFQRATDLDMGISVLDSAIRDEEHLTDAASLYAATLRLQKDRTNFSSAKAFLKEARKKIFAKMEQNALCCYLLDKAVSAEKSPGDTIPAKNKFKEQMDSENNLLQHHMDAIEMALHTPITPTYLKTRLRDIDTEKEAQELHDLLLSYPSSSIFKGFRLTKKLKYNFCSNELTYNGEKLRHMQFPEDLACMEDSILDTIKGIVKTRQTTKIQTSLNENIFNSSVMTREKFVNLLKPKIFKPPNKNKNGESDSFNYEITITAKNFEKFKSGCVKLPSCLRNHESSLKVILFRNQGGMFDDAFKTSTNDSDQQSKSTENSKNSLSLSCKEKEKLKKFLIKAGWIEKKEMRLRISSTIVEDWVDSDKSPLELISSKLPPKISKFTKVLAPLLIDGDSIKDEFIISGINLPLTEREGRRAIFKHLTSVHLLKEPCLKFPNLTDYDEIQAKVNGVKKVLGKKKFGSKLRELFLKYHGDVKKVEDDESDEDDERNEDDKRNEDDESDDDESDEDDERNEDDKRNEDDESDDDESDEDDERNEDDKRNEDDESDDDESDDDESDDDESDEDDESHDGDENSDDDESHDDDADDKSKDNESDDDEDDEGDEDKEKFKQYLTNLTEVLLMSIGTLKRHPKVGVNYHCLSTKVPMDGKRCQELDEFLRDGILHRVFEFKESLYFYENPQRLLVLVLGLLEVALGVALQIATGGPVSPFGNFLISEGGSDIFYSLKRLYQGERLDTAHYWTYKKENMIISGLTCLIPIAGAGAAPAAAASLRYIAKEIGKKVLKKFILQGGKAMVFSFIEDNYGKAIDNNLLGVKALLDGVIQSSAYVAQTALIMQSAERLRETSFETGQAERFIKHLFGGVSAVNSKSTFEIRLKETSRRLCNQLITWLTKDFIKRSLPIHLAHMTGLFGTANQKMFMNTSDEIQHFLISTLAKFNTEINGKIDRLARERDSFHGDLKSSKEEFHQFMENSFIELKRDLKTRICDFIYEKLCNPGVQQRIYESVSSCYRQITFPETRLEETNVWHEKDFVFHDEDNPICWEDENIVENANGRSRREVDDILGKGNTEYFTDSKGTYFVNVIEPDVNSSGMFLISQDPMGMDEYVAKRKNQLETL